MEKEKEPATETKHTRYYKNHAELVKERAHKRYFLKVHGISEPPPRRPSMKVKPKT